MNVLFVLTKAYGEQRSRREARTLAESGHTVIVLARKWNNPSVHSFNDGKVQVLFTPFILTSSLSHFVTKPFFFNPLYVVMVGYLVATRRIQILHVQDLPLMPLALLYRRLFAISVIFDHHENFPAQVRTWKRRDVLLWLTIRSGFWDALEKACALGADRNLVVCDEQRNHLVEIGVDERGVAVVGNTPDLNDPALWFNQPFETRNSPGAGNGQRFQLLYIGNIGHNRGLDTVIKAMAILKSHIPNLRFVVIGDGPALPGLNRLAAKLGVGADVFATGWMDPSLFALHINESDVCVVPHVADAHINTTYPNKLFEFMCCRRPVIVSDAVPLERIVIHEGRAGLSFRSGDPASLAQCITKLYSSPEICNEFVKRGRKLVEQKYNWKVDSIVLREVYDSLVKNRVHRIGDTRASDSECQ